MRLDTVISAENIRTMDPQRPRARRMGIWHGRVAGFDEDLDGVECVETIDLAGATVVPGFIDAHTHNGLTGLRMQALDIADCGSIEAGLAKIARAAEAMAADAWIDVHGYDPRGWGRDLTAAELDLAGGGRRVWVRHISSHSAVVSSAVLTAARTHGWHGDIPATGLLLDDDQDLVSTQRLPYARTEMEMALRLAGEHCLSQGVTMCVEAGIGAGIATMGATELAVYQSMAAAGDLPVRMQVMIADDALHVNADGGGRTLDLGLHTGLGDAWLSVGAMKFWIDGGMMVRSAAVSEPYVGSDNTGTIDRDEDATIGRVVDAHRAGWQVAIHAIGDRAVDLALTALEAAQDAHPRSDARHRIEHGGLIRDDQLDRLARLQLGIATQPCFLWYFGDDYAAIVGPERSRLLYRGRALLDRGIRLIGSTDRPLPGSPLVAIQFMVERRTASGQTIGVAERITVDEAMAAFTVNAAWGSRRDHELGSLATGKLADFAVLAGDPWHTDAADIGGIAVAATYIGGALRWQSPDA